MLDDKSTLGVQERAGQYIESFGARRSHLIDGTSNLFSLHNSMHRELDSAFTCCIFQPDKLSGPCYVVICQCCNAPRMRDQFTQNFQTLAVELGGKDTNSGGVAPRLSKRVHQSCTEHIIG